MAIKNKDMAGTNKPAKEVKKEAQDVPTKVVKEKVIEEKVVVKRKRRRMSLKTMIRLFIFLVFASVFVGFGIYLANNIIPSVTNWLEDHNFIENQNETTDKETRSPFLPQPTQVDKNDDNDNNDDSVAVTIPDIVDSVSPSVVSIAVKNTVLSRRGRTLQESTNNIGTGFIVVEDGLIVTNQHVVSNLNAEYEVVTQDNESYEVEEIIRDTVNDIAFIKIKNARVLPTVKLGSSDDVRVGETVIAIGTPLGEYPGSVTVGVVSGLGRTVQTGDGFWELRKEYENVLQTDAAVNPGNSGGPLINLNGEVIGVNFATTGGADNISFALPVDLVKEKIAEYEEFGEFKTPFLGVSSRIISEQEAVYYDVEVGALVRSVVAGSPAEKAGLKVGDIITEVNGDAVDFSLASVVGKYKVGDSVKVTVFRIDDDNKASTVTLTVTLAEKPSAE